MKMFFQISGFGYDYYIGKGDNGKYVYNLVPTDQPAPAGGYYSKEYILKIKNVPDLFGNLVTFPADAFTKYCEGDDDIAFDFHKANS